MKILDINDNYITKEEFLIYSGINLELELPKSDDEGNKANRYIHQVELFVLGQLNPYEKQEVNDLNIGYIKLAIVEQLVYSLSNTNDVLCEKAKNWLRKGGFMNIRRGV